MIKFFKKKEPVDDRQEFYDKQYKAYSNGVDAKNRLCHITLVLLILPIIFMKIGYHVRSYIFDIPNGKTGGIFITSFLTGVMIFTIFVLVVGLFRHVYVYIVDGEFQWNRRRYK